MKARYAAVFLLALLYTGSTQAQSIDPSVVAISGGMGQAGGMQVSWTVGQTAVSTYTSHAGVVSEGFQQAFLAVIPTRGHPVSFSLDLYPNPTRSSLLVSLKGVEEDMTLLLHNMLGEVVKRTEVRRGDQLARLSVESLPSGMYMLVVFTGSGEKMGLYKIVKAQ